MLGYSNNEFKNKNKKSTILTIVCYLFNYYYFIFCNKIIIFHCTHIIVKKMFKTLIIIIYFYNYNYK